MKSATAADTTPPVLTSLTLPKTIDVTNGGGYFSFSAGATDDGTGISDVIVRLDHAYQDQSSNSQYIDFFNGFSDGKSTTSEYFNSTTAAGTYNISEVYVYDKAGNYTDYTASQLTAMGIKTSFEVVDKSATVTAEVDTPSGVTEGYNKSLPLSLTLHDVSSTSVDVTVTVDKADTTATGFDLDFAGSYTISQSPAGDYVIDLPALAVPDGVDASGGTLALSVHATGQVFDSGTDTEIVRIKVDDEDQTGTAAADHLVGSAHDDRLAGAGGNDTLEGGKGNDRLDGGAGDDTLVGGKGDDTYILDSAGDRVSEAAGQGTDTVISAHSWTLGDNLENLTLTGSHVRSGTGNALANVMIAGSGATTLSGLGGADTLTGGKGDDTLVGGAGQDRMTGGAGADVFAFAAGDTAGSNAAADTITDFSHVQGDRIDLHLIDARAGGKDDAFHWIGDAAFDGHAGELHFRYSGADTLVSGDLDGDGHGDFQIRLSGHLDLVKGDFVL